MKVEYVEQENNDLSVVNAARVSFDKVSEIMGDGDTRLINYLAKHNHWTPFAHQRFTFECSETIFNQTPTDPLLFAGMVHNEDFSKVRHSFYGWFKLIDAGLIMDDCIGDIQSELWSAMPVSSNAFAIQQSEPEFNCLLVTDEIDPLFIDVTLRMGAPVPIRTHSFKHKVCFLENEESRRYISSEPVVFMPSEFRVAADSVKQGSGGVHYDSGHWKVIYKNSVNTSIHTYNLMIEDGICPEQARLVLPQGCMVNWIWTGNLKAFARFYNQRTDPHAQLEVRTLAHMVGDVIAPLYPVSWAALINYNEEENT